MTMTNTKNMKKQMMLEILRSLNIECNEKMTKIELQNLYANYENERNEIIKTIQNNEIIYNNDNQIMIIDEINANNETISNFQKTMNEYVEFLNEKNAIYEINENNDTFHIIANKKHILIQFIEIDENIVHMFVYTILNTKSILRENARNILTLKSLKATKSYTISNMK